MNYKQKYYSSFFFKNPKNLDSIVSMGHDSYTIPECLSKCLSNSDLEENIRSHLSQYIETLPRLLLPTINNTISYL